MIINNFNNKKYIETTDTEVIFYKWYGKRKFLKEKIRAAHMYDDYKVEVLYGNKVESINVPNIKRDDRAYLNKLFEELNWQGNKFLKVDEMHLFYEIWIWSIIFSNILLNINDVLIDIVIIGILMAIAVLLMKMKQKKAPIYNLFIFNEDKNKIFLENILLKDRKEYSKEDKNVYFKYDKELLYIPKLRGNMRVEIKNNIIYPRNHKTVVYEAIKEMSSNQ